MDDGNSGEETGKIGSGEVLPSYLWLLRDLDSEESFKVTVKETRLVVRKREETGAWLRTS